MPIHGEIDAGTANACVQAIKDAINDSTEPFEEFSRSLQLLALRNIHMTGSSDTWHSQAVDDARGGGAIVRIAIDKRAFLQEFRNPR